MNGGEGGRSLYNPPMFDRLTEGFSNAFRRFSGQGRISEANVREALGDVRTALLEADVQYDLVDEFCERVVADTLGAEVTKSLKPGEQFIGAVHKSLVDFMTPPEGTSAGIPQMRPGPTIIMMCGLQGSGKTTTCGKLAAYLKKQNRSVMLAAADLQRPAAVEQLQTVVDVVNDRVPKGPKVQFYGEIDKVAAYGKAVGVAVAVCSNALKAARAAGIDTLILDTAGRLHVNDELMKELESVRRAVQPHQVLLVADAMTGQDAVNSAKSFHDRLAVDGVILTKFDSDTRGGAALTVRKVTGAPIKFIGVGEHPDQLEEFHAERIAGRILGMGDVVSLVEKAQEEISEEDAQRMADKMAKGELTMDDFLDQLRSLRRLGPMKQLLGMLPGVGQMLKDVTIEEKQLDRTEGIVRSMTKAERTNIKLLQNPSRRKRIAQGSGTKQEQVAQLVKQFDVVSKMTKQMAGMGLRDKLRAAKDLQGAGMMPGLPLAGLGEGKRSTHMASPKGKFKKRKR